MPTCSLLAIGNELLNGEIRDLNLYTLSQSLTHLGFCVNQAVIVRDSPASIGSGLGYLLASRPDVVLCSGGLGPTGDDLTLQSLAQYLGRDLVLNAEARRMVEAQYDQLIAAGYLEQRGPEAAREKMARLPDGARPLPNPVGTAPAVCVEAQDTILYVLPGVPAELDAIFAASVVPELQQRFSSASGPTALRVFVDDEACCRAFEASCDTASGCLSQVAGTTLSGSRSRGTARHSFDQCRERQPGQEGRPRCAGGPGPGAASCGLAVYS